MADESTIYSTLLAYSAFTALIGASTPRFYDQIVPVNQTTAPARPYVIATVISAVPENMLAEAPGTFTHRLQFDIYADSKSSARSVLTQLRNGLYAAGHYGCENNALDLPADDPNLRRISSDWSFVL